MTEDQQQQLRDCLFDLLEAHLCGDETNMLEQEGRAYETAGRRDAEIERRLRIRGSLRAWSTRKAANQ